MLSKIKFYQATGTDPYQNLAVEQWLTEQVQEGEILLYLWQNERTVVIGRNQNAWKEVDLAALAADGGKLARRFSGGGAVYHDLGNLNFSFCVRRSDYDVERQLDVIAGAVQSFGIPAVRTGRNDLEARGRKFSGNAFTKTEAGCCHHGTIMLRVDEDRLSRYLTVSREKLVSKGVDSVRARVGNLADWCPDLTVERLSVAIRESMARTYDLPIEMMETSKIEQLEAVCMKTAYLQSQEWLYGRKIPFTIAEEKRFSWGSAEVELEIDRGVVRSVRCMSDAMDTELPKHIEEALIGCRFDKEDLRDRLAWNEELADWAESWI